MPNEYLISVNNFKEPKVLTDDKAIIALIVRLILMEPGSRISIPEAGVGLKSKYKYLMEDDVTELELDIRDQMSKYLPPEVQSAQVECNYEPTDNPADGNQLTVTIKTENSISKFDMNELNSFDLPGGAHTRALSEI